MRLVCPNCDAQYEVDDALTPAGGRDVQCSNCGHTWFQRAAGEPEPEPEVEEQAEEEIGAEPSLPEVDYPEEPEAETPEPEEIPAEAEAEPKPKPEPAPEPEPEEEEPAPRRRSLDESLAEVLREEAERERRAREAETLGSTWEEQQDLGLDEAMPAPGRRQPEAEPEPEEPEHVARLRGIEPDTDEAPGSRRDLLPDIEEINYTLRSTSERKRSTAAPSTEEAEEVPQRGGFRLGFALVLILAGIALAAYVLAPQIAEQMPQMEPALKSYVAAVDRMRIGLESMTTILIQKISSLSS